MNHPVDVLDQVVNDLDGLVRAVSVSGWSDADKLDVLRAAGDVVRRAEAPSARGAEPAGGAETPASPAAYAEAAFAKLDEVTARDYAPAASPRDGDPYEPAD